jgi:hypothetical protein
MVASGTSWSRVRRRRRIWIGIALVAGLVQVAFGYLSLHPHPFESAHEHAIRLAKTHGIMIGYGHPSTFFVPPFGPTDVVTDGMQVPGAAPESVPPALDGVEASLVLYPPGFVSKFVQAIFIAGDIRVNGALSGGFTGPTWFVLAAPESSGAEGIRTISLVGVHHELSSFVLRKANALGAWTAFAPTNWSFATTREEALARGGTADPAVETGFLSAYGATTAENDFNTYAERIFTDPEALVALACKHALVRKKLLLVLRTYVAFDARMDKVFRDLGVDGAHLCERPRRWPW